MEAKAKSSSKSASRAEKKDPIPTKPDPAPAEPVPPTEPEKSLDDGAAGQEGEPEGGEGKGSGCEMLEHLKPFLIGGAIVALGAVLVGAILLAKKN